MIQVIDLRGRLNIFAIAHDESIWRFREPGNDRQWLVQPLGGRAAAISHAVALSSDGLFQVWAVSRNHTISVSYEKPDNAGWTSWNRVAAPPAQDVTIAIQPEKGTLVVQRGVDGVIEFSRQKTLDGRLEHMQRLDVPAASRPVLVGTGTSDPELVFKGKDGTLRAVTLSEEVKPDVRTLQGPPVAGDPSTATLADGGTLVVARGTSGEIFAIEKKEGRWSEVLKPLPLSVPTSGMLKVLGLGDRKFLVMAQGLRNTLHVALVSDGKWFAWTDTQVPVSATAVPAISTQGRTVYANGGMLSSLTKALAQFSVFTIFADNVTPTPTVEGDEVSVAFTVSNHGDGRWDNSRVLGRHDN
jgi:hypothetical protein